jgi:hypothetical protein
LFFDFEESPIAGGEGGGMMSGERREGAVANTASGELEVWGEGKLQEKYTTCQNQPRTPEGCQVVRSQEALLTYVKTH